MLRELTNLELDYVSGGDDEQPPPSEDDGIVVWGTSLNSLSDDLWSYGGINESYEGSPYGLQPIAPLALLLIEAAVVLITTIVGTIIADEILDSEQAEAERNIKEKASDTNLREVGSHDGKPVYKGSDGWYYTDSDGNGKLDTRWKANTTNGFVTSISVDNGNSIRVVSLGELRHRGLGI